jgi:drug/metabolite transporter (DMT)-like permease
MYTLFVIISAILIGFFNIGRKLSSEKSSEVTILVMFSSLTFLLTLIWIPFGISIPNEFILLFLIKGLLLSLLWYLIFKVLKQADLSLVTICEIISALLSFCLGIIIFNESFNSIQIIGAIIILLGVSSFNLIDKNKSSKSKLIHFFLLLLCSIITSLCNVLDKYTTSILSIYQIHFWSLLFVTLFSWIFFIFECYKNKKFLINKIDLKNYWIYLISLLLFIGDYLIFLAYKAPNSQMITIILLSKLQIIIPVLASITIFKETNTKKKLLLTGLVVLGAILISI